MDIRIDRVGDIVPGYIATVPINLIMRDSSLQLSGFSLLIGYDPGIANFVEVRPGDIIASCNWEYFTYFSSPFGGPDCTVLDCPDLQVRIVAIADANNGSIHPVCFGETGGTLAELRFRLLNGSQIGCQSLPLRWTWFECTDNIVSLSTGTQYISSSVWEYNPFYELTDLTNESTFPTTTGAPGVCVASPAERGIRFINGAIDVMCFDSIDGRGDINMNFQAYEIADFVMLTWYFLVGTDAFTNHAHGSAVNSDANGDRRILTVADLLYLHQVVSGEYPAIPRQESGVLAGDTAFILQDTVARTVSLDYSPGLRTLQLTFMGQVMPTDTAIGEYLIHAEYRDPVTRVLVSLADITDTVGTAVPFSGQLFSYTGDGKIVASDAAYDGLAVVPSLPPFGTNCCQSRGNFEGPGDPSGMADLSDLMLLVDYVFGPPGEVTPSCTMEADVDMNWRIDISDITVMVDYLFFNKEMIRCP